MSDNKDYCDLCMTCVQAPTCKRRSSHEKEIWYCEEFDDHTPKMSSLKIVEDEKREGEKIEGRDLGLCLNCDNRNSCTHPILEGGIWHCENYR